jgi:hypothetical protein
VRRCAFVLAAGRPTHGEGWRIECTATARRLTDAPGRPREAVLCHNLVGRAETCRVDRSGAPHATQSCGDHSRDEYAVD